MLGFESSMSRIRIRVSKFQTRLRQVKKFESLKKIFKSAWKIFKQFQIQKKGFESYLIRFESLNSCLKQKVSLRKRFEFPQKDSNPLMKKWRQGQGIWIPHKTESIPFEEFSNRSEKRKKDSNHPKKDSNPSSGKWRAHEGSESLQEGFESILKDKASDWRQGTRIRILYLRDLNPFGRKIQIAPRDSNLWALDSNHSSCKCI